MLCTIGPLMVSQESVEETGVSSIVCGYTHVCTLDPLNKQSYSICILDSQKCQNSKHQYLRWECDYVDCVCMTKNSEDINFPLFFGLCVRILCAVLIYIYTVRATTSIM